MLAPGATCVGRHFAVLITVIFALGRARCKYSLLEKKRLELLRLSRCESSDSETDGCPLDVGLFLVILDRAVPSPFLGPPAVPHLCPYVPHTVHVVLNAHFYRDQEYQHIILYHQKSLYAPGDDAGSGAGSGAAGQRAADAQVEARFMFLLLLPQPLLLVPPEGILLQWCALCVPPYRGETLVLLCHKLRLADFKSIACLRWETQYIAHVVLRG